MGVFNAEKAAEWSQRMVAFEASGQSRRSWCKAQGLSVNTFGYWHHRLRDRLATATVSSRSKRLRSTTDRLTTVASTVVPVVVRSPSMVSPAPSPASAAVAPAVELVWPNGLRLSTSLGIADLAALVRALSC